MSCNSNIHSSNVTVDVLRFDDGTYMTSFEKPSTLKIFTSNLVSNTTINDLTTLTQLYCFQTTPFINQGGFTATLGGVTVPDTGIYRLSFSAYLFSITNRSNATLRWGVNGSSYSTFKSPSQSGYIRDANGHQNSSLLRSDIFSLNAGDTINLFRRREGASGTVTLEGNESFFSVLKVG